jgi:hypothetical protein
VPVFEGCHATPIMAGMSKEEMDEWGRFYGSCQEVAQGSAAMLQPVDVKMFKVLVSGAEMSGGGQLDPSAQHFGPLPELAGACFTGEITFASCCNTRNGKQPTGDDNCWAGEYSFQTCCQSLPGQSTAPPDHIGTSGVVDVKQYHAECTTQNIMTCVPACNEAHHGYELLATIDGTDTKFGCNVANQLFSWLGAAAMGGFLGHNLEAFVSAVISGAAGTYVLTLVEDADVSTDLTIQPGQNVIISGDPRLAEAPRWGSGGFTLGEGASLALTSIDLGTGDIIIYSGATASFQSVIWGEIILQSYSCDEYSCSGQLASGDYDGTQQCFAEYTDIMDGWRSNTASEQRWDGPYDGHLVDGDVPHHADVPVGNSNCHPEYGYRSTGVGGDRWYRFNSPTGSVIPNHSPGRFKCGTPASGWMSGIDADATPIQDCMTCTNVEAGVYPLPTDGVVRRVICFDYNTACQNHVVANVINCGRFFLWRLPYTSGDDNCGRAYCTAPSALGLGRRLLTLENEMTNKTSAPLKNDDEQSSQSGYQSIVEMINFIQARTIPADIPAGIA